MRRWSPSLPPSPKSGPIASASRLANKPAQPFSSTWSASIIRSDYIRPYSIGVPLPLNRRTSQRGADLFLTRNVGLTDPLVAHFQGTERRGACSSRGTPLQQRGFPQGLRFALEPTLTREYRGVSLRTLGGLLVRSK